MEQSMTMMRWRSGRERRASARVWLAGCSLGAWLSACGGGASEPPSSGEPAMQTSGGEASTAAAPPLPTPPPAAGAGTSAAARVHGEEITYEVDGQTYRGYLAYDESQTDVVPGVLVVHEWWGQNEYARRRARMLAEMGYVALALDMYGDGKVTEHPADAKKFAGEVIEHLPSAERRFVAAAELLRAHPRVDGGRIAAIGYCFGGGIALHAARRNLVPLRGVASFHGMLAPLAPGQPDAIAAKIIVFTGDADPFVPVDTAVAFEREMKAAQADARVVHYPTAKHAFTNPDATAVGERNGLPLQYDAAADADSWAELERFLSEVFAAQGESGES